MKPLTIAAESSHIQSAVVKSVQAQFGKYRWAEPGKHDPKNPLQIRAEKLVDRASAIETTKMRSELSAAAAFERLIQNPVELNGKPDMVRRNELSSKFNELVQRASVRGVIPLLVATGVVRYGVSRLTTTLTEFLAEMEPPNMDQVRGMDYQGPHAVGFRYGGREYLAVRFLGYNQTPEDEKLMSDHGFACEFDVPGWTFIRDPSAEPSGDCIRTELHDSTIDRDLNNMADLPVVRRILYNLMLGWESGVFYDAPTDKAADAIRPVTIGGGSEFRFRAPPYRYVHLGPRGEKLHGEQRMMRERMNDPTFRLSHWFVRAHFRRIDDRSVAVAAHYRSRNPARLSGEPEPTTIITL